MGFCEDYKPDDKIYKIREKLFISSQDGAQNLEELKRHNVSHILNVGTGIENAFRQVRLLLEEYYNCIKFIYILLCDNGMFVIKCFCPKLAIL